MPAAITYFSRNDEWVYTAVYDNDVCSSCLEYEGQMLSGDMLRSLFRDLQIVDIDVILPNVHPNCRCHLDRVLYYGDVGVEK